MKKNIIELIWVGLTATTLAAGKVESLNPQRAAEGGQVFRSSSTNRIVLVSVGVGEAASIGSYSIRVMDTDGIGGPARLKAGVLLPRDGGIVKVWRGNLRGFGLDEVAVWLQSAGSGAYGSLKLFIIGATNLVLVALPDPSAGLTGYMGHDGFDIDAKGIHWVCPLYGKHLELNIATNLGSVSIKYPTVRISGDRNAEPHGGQMRRRYDATANQWIRD